MRRFTIVLLQIFIGIGMVFASDYLFVHADVANIRDSADGEIIDRLDINTKVFIQKKVGSWFQIGYDDNKKSGWVHMVVLGNMFLTEKDIIDSITANDGANEKWAERLVHAYPDNKKNWLRLLEIYKETKNSTGIVRVEKYLKGLTSVFFAKCKCGEMQLLGELDSAASFQTKVFMRYVSPNFQDAIDSVHAELYFMKYQLPHLHWYSLAGEIKRNIFSDARVIGKKIGSYCYKYKTDMESEGHSIFYLSLGKCSGDSVYCTSAMSRVKWDKELKPEIDSCRILKNLTADIGYDGYIDTVYEHCSLTVVTENYRDAAVFEVTAYPYCHEYTGGMQPSRQWVNAVFNYNHKRIYPAKCLPEIDGPEYANKSDRFFDTPFFLLEKMPKDKVFNIGSYGDVEMGTTNYYYHEDLMTIDKKGIGNSFEIITIQGPG